MELKLVVADHRVDITLWHIVFRFEEKANYTSYSFCLITYASVYNDLPSFYDPPLTLAQSWQFHSYTRTHAYPALLALAWRTAMPTPVRGYCCRCNLYY